jgi:transposase
MSAPNPDCPGCQMLLARVAELEARQAELETVLAKLQARLSQNSSNSSRPPSSDMPSGRKPAPKGSPSGRKPGGQPGHKGAFRPFKPMEAADEIVAQIPLVCAHCRTPLPPEIDLDEPVRRHQVIDLSPKLTTTTEYQLHRRTCPVCGGQTQAALPEGVPTGVIAPRLQAFCALLTGRFHLSRRSVTELLATVFGEEIALGTVSSLEAATARALSAVYDEAAQAVAEADAVNVDETPWRQGKQKAWLWVGVTPQITCFRIDPSRSRAALEKLVPPTETDSPRTVTSDRFSVYQHFAGDAWQICWSHLNRDFTALAEMKAETPRQIGEAALAESEVLFDRWHQYRRGEIDRTTLQEEMRPVQERFEALLKRAEASDHWRAAPLGWNLLSHFDSLWTFVRREGVEPTNNAAERAVRPAVLWRKSSFGTQSERGRTFTERLLTVVTSLRSQGRDVLEYLEAAIRAVAVGGEVPSLAPIGTQ